MKNIKYFLFSMLCIFVSSIVFAKDEITIEKMIPVYDENSGVIVSEENGVHSVVFNDKDQNVKYNIVLKNNTKRDISLKDIVLPESPEEFFKYELVGIDESTVLEPNSTEEVVLSLETVKTEGWGRNFTLDLTNKVEVLDNVVNPNTSAQELIVLFFAITFIAGIVTVCLNNKKVSRYVVLVVMFGSLMSVTNAKDSIILPIKLNVSFESQNVMQAAGCIVDEGVYCDSDYWDSLKRYDIRNLYIINDIDEVLDYVISFDISDKQDESIMAYIVECPDELGYYDVYWQADGIIYANEDASYYFVDMRYLDKIHNIKGFDTSKVTDMSYMFYNTSISNNDFTLDLSTFNTSNVINMSNMFSGIIVDNLKFYSDLKSFDTSNVTDMNRMFAFMTTNYILDLTSFDTSKVTDMSDMFSYLSCDSSDLTIDLSSFDTSNVTDMSYMFYSTCYNSQDFTLDVSNFDTSNVTDMSSMFYSTGNNSETFLLDVSNFDTSNVTDMSWMFSSTGENSTNLSIDLSSFDTSKVTDMSYMFYETGYNSLVFTLDVSNFDTSNVENMYCMFSNTGYNSEIFDLDTSNFDMSKVMYFSNMFENAGYNSTKFITSITISNPKTSKYNNMFKNVATKEGAKLTVNYTSETSSLVDKMIATKSSNSNVVKGVQVD